MNNNGKNNGSRRRYSQGHYKKLVIEDKQEIEQSRDTRKNRIDSVREDVMQEAGYVDGYKQAMQKKHAKEVSSKAFNIGKKAVVIVMIIGILVLAGVAVVPASAKSTRVDGYEVLLNGTVLGVTDTIEPVSKGLQAIRTEFREDYNMNVYDDTVLEYNPVQIDMQFVCPPEFFVDILKECVDVKVLAWVIMVNNAPAAAVKTQEEADEALERVLEPFRDIPTTRKRIEIGFVENVEVVEKPIEYSQVGSSEEAYKLLRFGGDIVETKHTVVSGESLYSISKNYDLKVSDLKKANPKLASTSKIYPGDVLLAVEPLNRVNIKFVEEIDRQEPMDYKTEEIEDDTMFVTETKVVQEGIEGIHDINARITFINGVEAEIDVISETVLIEPIDQVIRKGTKQVPKIQKLASSGKMPIPLKSGSYRISSKFGPRNIDVVGASTWHKGVDLAANTGTPIYASASGVVTKSGSGTGYGLYIKIDHGEGVETRYGHCSQLIAKAGDHVNAGELIALVGNTGISGGSHLHFEVRINGKAWDPLGKYPTPAP